MGSRKFCLTARKDWTSCLEILDPSFSFKHPRHLLPVVFTFLHVCDPIISCIFSMMFHSRYLFSFWLHWRLRDFWALRSSAALTRSFGKKWVGLLRSFDRILETRVYPKLVVRIQCCILSSEKGLMISLFWIIVVVFCSTSIVIWWRDHDVTCFKLVLQHLPKFSIPWKILGLSHG